MVEQEAAKTIYDIVGPLREPAPTKREVLYQDNMIKEILGIANAGASERINMAGVGGDRIIAMYEKAEELEAKYKEKKPEEPKTQ